MKISKIKVDNFRLLRDVVIDFKEELSLIIGKNNCGKTSTIIILEKMLNDNKITWDDINIERQQEIFNLIKDSSNNSDIEAARLQVFIEYSDQDSYENIQQFMMDLNPDNNMIVLEFVAVLKANKIKELNTIINHDNLDFKSFYKYMKKYSASYISVEKYARRYDPNKQKLTEERSELLDSKDIKKVIQITGIRADRTVSNDPKNHELSKLIQKYYKDLDTETAGEGNKVLAEFQQIVSNFDEVLGDIYNGKKEEKNKKGVFQKLINAVNAYGGVGSDIGIIIESEISEMNLLENNTKLYYSSAEEAKLPETSNGLGYLNLMGMIIDIEIKLSDIRLNPADVNLLYIEEPEAHTHPQMQYIFIRNIKKHIERHKSELANVGDGNIQILLTSHSSHIVSECDFNDMIYLKKEGKEIKAKNFNLLYEEYEDDKQQSFKFIKQYLTVHRCELFFTEKVICIEGDTERILLPTMLQKIDQSHVEQGDLPLLSQNISIIETGAHFHTFKPLFNFLGLKVLVITDIDSVKKEIKANKKGEDSTTYPKCSTQEATHTSNASIKYFFNKIKKDPLPVDDSQFTTLKNKEFTEKVHENIRIAYQLPESDNGYLARSFEDAFISLNKKFILNNKENFTTNNALKNFTNEDIEDFYSFADDKVISKSAFATTVLFYDGDQGETWKVPKYIEEGLIWIQQD